jgi:hypothetical protein
LKENVKSNGNVGVVEVERMALAMEMGVIGNGNAINCNGGKV